MAHPAIAHHGNALPYFIAGPVLLLFLLGVAACTLLIARLSRTDQRTLLRCSQAADQLQQQPLRCALWGLSAAVLDFAASAVLVHTHVLLLVGGILFYVGLALLGAGLVVAALSTGALLTSADSVDEAPLPGLGRGLAVLLLASCVPVAGWLLVLGWLAAGTGAVLETLLKSRGEFRT